MVAPARGRGFDCRRVGGVVHRGQRRRLSQLPKLRLAQRAIVQPYNRALATGAADDSRCCADLEKESGKDEITLPGASFWSGRRNVRWPDVRGAACDSHLSVPESAGPIPVL